MFSGLKMQYKLSDFLSEQLINPEHGLLKIKSFIDYEKINKIYQGCFPSQKGNASKNTELVIGLLLLEHLFNLSDEGVVKQLHENIYFMNFCSVSPEEIKEARENNKNKQVIDRTTLVKVRGRLGPRRIKKIERIVFKQLKKAGVISGKTLITDTTSIEKNIIYPTEISLLKRVIEAAEMVCQKIIYKKEMIKTQVIKKANQISKIYYSSGQKTKELLTSCGQQLLTIAKGLVEKAKATIQGCSKKTQKKLHEIYDKVATVGVKILEQVTKKMEGEKVEDKIVSYFEEHARALPKGKIHKPCEFGVKGRIDMEERGYITNYECYLGNPADVTMIEKAMEEHSREFGKTFKEATADRGFYDEELNAKLEEKYGVMLAIPHKKDRKDIMGEKKESIYQHKRPAIEAKISEGKRVVGLGKSMYKGYFGDQIWLALSVLSLNLRRYLREAT